MPVFDIDSTICSRAAFVSATFILASCGGGGGGNEAPNAAPSAIVPTRVVAQTDLQIAATIYAGASRTPPDFYAETAPSGHGHVSTTHLKNSDLIAAPATTQSKYELCTNDWNQALSWSETSAHNAQTHSDLVATNDELRYFEFGRVQAGEPQTYVQSRVYKCDYLNRSAADLDAGSGAAGSLNIRPLTSEELRRLSEYLWQFTTYNNFGHVVLKSSGASTSTSLEHTLHIGRLVRGGVSTSCDRIEVIAWRHSVDTTTGTMTLSTQPLWNFGAKEDATIAQLCSN